MDINVISWSVIILHTGTEQSYPPFLWMITSGYRPTILRYRKQPFPRKIISASKLLMCRRVTQTYTACDNMSLCQKIWQEKKSRNAKLKVNNIPRITWTRSAPAIWAVKITVFLVICSWVWGHSSPYKYLLKKLFLSKFVYEFFLLLPF